MTPKIDPKAELKERKQKAYDSFSNGSFGYEEHDHFMGGYTAGLQDQLVQDLVSAATNLARNSYTKYQHDSVEVFENNRRKYEAALSAYQAAIGGKGE